MATFVLNVTLYKCVSRATLHSSQVQYLAIKKQKKKKQYTRSTTRCHNANLNQGRGNVLLPSPLQGRVSTSLKTFVWTVLIRKNFFSWRVTAASAGWEVPFLSELLQTSSLPLNTYRKSCAEYGRFLFSLLSQGIHTVLHAALTEAGGLVCYRIAFLLLIKVEFYQLFSCLFLAGL